MTRVKVKKSDADFIAEELERIESKNGTLRPEDVVEFARKNRRSVLHRQFEWDDGVAAELYRLDQARSVIRVYVKVIPRPDDGERVVVAKYVSLPDHRGRGYERMDVVIEDDDRREALLVDTIRRLQAIKEVKLFVELDSVREAIERAAAACLPFEPDDRPAPPPSRRRRGSHGEARP